MTAIFEQFLGLGLPPAWQSEILPLQVISDGLIALAYFTIAITLGIVGRKRHELPFRRFVGLSGAFVIAGGATYALATWTLWHPDLFLESAFKAVTAIVSIGAAIALVRVAPTVVGLRSPHELQEVNDLLERSNAELAAAYRELAELNAQEQATIDNLGEGIVVFDQTQRVVRHNRAAELLLEAGDAGIGEHDFDFAYHVVDCDGAPFRSERWPMRLARETAATHSDVIGVGVEEYRRWLAVTATPVRGPQPLDPIVRVILSLRDITNFQARENEHTTTARQLDALHAIAISTKTLHKDRIDAALLGVLRELQLDRAYYGVVDRSTNELVVENTVAVRRDFDNELHIGDTIALGNSVAGDVLERCDVLALGDLTVVNAQAGIERAGEGGAYVGVPLLVDGEPYGAIAFRSDRARTLPFSDENVAFVRLVGNLISSAIENTVQRERLDSLAFFDALTALPNRVLLSDRIVQNIVAARRYGERFAVLSVDLDAFAELNERYGYAVGDEVLKRVATRLRAAIRESDTVARLGDDEFVVLAPRIETVVGAATLANKLTAVIAKPISIKGKECVVSASIGIAVFPADGTDMTTLVRSAERALAEAKRDGTGRIRFASEALPSPLPELVAPT